MKLYAKIKAHKKQHNEGIIVEKGQGTNEYMSILLNDEDGRNLIEIYSEVRGNEIFTSVNDYSTGEKKTFLHELARGEKKKGKHDCDVDCKFEHMCKGTDCKKYNPHNCQ